jgi:CRP-like cAMP-binding protein
MGGDMVEPADAERLSQFWVLDGFSESELGQVGHFVQEMTFPPGATLFEQGDVPAFFYLLERGEVQEIGKDADGVDIQHRRTEAGDYVGHRPLMDDTPCQTTAQVSQGVGALVINADDFKTLLAMFPRLEARLRRIEVVNRLLAIPLFGEFSEEQLFHVADLVRLVFFPAGQIIFHQGEPADAFYVIDTGQVVERAVGQVPGQQAWPKYLSAGSFFGRYALLSNTTRRATAEAGSDVDLFRLNADAFHWLRELQPSFERNLKRHSVIEYLRRSRLSSELTDEELKHLAGYVGLAHYRPGDTLYRQGEVDPTLYVLYEGEAIVRARDEDGNERPVDYLAPGNAVGESSLFLGDARDVTVEATTLANWFYLTRTDLDQFLQQHQDLVETMVPREEVRARWRLDRPTWLEHDEQVVMRYRRHWFRLVSRLVLPFFFFSLAVFLIPWAAALTILGFVLLGLVVLWSGWILLDWLNDYYYVTTARVAHREKTLLIRETRDETPLDKIQNINIDRHFVGNILGFGTLVIDTAAAIGASRVTFDYLQDPEILRDEVFVQMDRALAGESVQMRRAIRDKLEDTIRIGIRPTVPRPAVPSPALDPEPTPASPSVLKRVDDATLGRVFWIEKVMDDRIIWRKHWIRLLARIWLPVLAVSASLLASVAFFWFAGGSSLIVSMLLLSLLAGSSLWLWWNWVDWGNDQYIVTDDRIIDVEALPAGFRRRTTETQFDRIQNVSFEIPNPIATLFNYGTVAIFTAGLEGKLDFEWVPDPRRVQAEIFRRLSAYEEAQRTQQREERWSDLPQWFAVYEDTYRR